MSQRRTRKRNRSSAPAAQSSPRTPTWPFAAIVGLELTKRALLLLAIEPKLKGVLITAGAGTAKSTLARAFASLLLSDGAAMDPEPDGSAPCQPYLELPIGITEDRLLGGLDLELTLKTGARQAQPGLLAAAHRGILYVDGINLLEASAANHLGRALSDGRIVLEREGLSEIYPADFLLIGTYDPAEGEAGAALRDRVGLLVNETAALSTDERAEIARRALDYARDPSGFAASYASATAKLKRRIAAARDRLPAVEITVEDRRRLALAAVRLGVESNRADIFALRAACAHAALAGRDRVEAEDLAAAIELTLAPRALIVPAPEEVSPEAEAQAAAENQPSVSASASESTSADEPSESSNAQPLSPDSQSLASLILRARETPLPEDLLAVPDRWQRRSASGSRGEVLNRSRGRYITIVAGNLRAGKIALDATLRAAAPQQTVRGPKSERQRLRIEPEDLRFKRFKQKAGMLFIFAVDASGSMALNRMGQAKGALIGLLKAAYVHRDKVALVSFRGREAEVLLPISQSSERAKRALEALPVGGGTPLAAGLLAALKLAQRARRLGIRQTMLVLFTDGRANVGLDAEEPDPALRPQKIRREIELIGAALQREGVTSLVIDTQEHFTSRGEGRALAEWLGGRYFYLPRASVAEINAAVAGAAAAERG
jgi:magnesium chelatase subunit D